MERKNQALTLATEQIFQKASLHLKTQLFIKLLYCMFQLHFKVVWEFYEGYDKNFQLF